MEGPSCMTSTRPAKTFVALVVLSAFSLGLPENIRDSSFGLSLSGHRGNGSAYSFQLNKAGDSGVVIVNGIERPVRRSDFRRLRSAIVNYAMDLTEAAYGTPRDSTDFSGELTIAALDRNSVIRLTAALTLGDLDEPSMTGLLELLMKQVADTLRLKQCMINK